MKYRLSAIVALTTILAAQNSIASQRGNFYFVGNLGINIADGSTEFKRNTTPFEFDLEHDTGFDISIGMGYRHNKFLRADAQVGYAQADYDLTEETFFGFPTAIGELGSHDTSFTHLTLNGYIDIPLGNLLGEKPTTYSVPVKNPPVTGLGLFVGAGGGMAFSDGNIGGLYQGMAGATYAFDNGLNLDLGYKYVQTLDTFEVDNLFIVNGSPTGGPLNVPYEVDYKSSVVQTGIRYNF